MLLLDDRLDMRCQYAPATQKVKHVLACIKRSVDSGARQATLYSAPLFLDCIWNTASPLKLKDLLELVQSSTQG